MARTDGLLLLPLRDVADDLAAARLLTIDVITPPYRCAGLGELRVVRVDERAHAVALTVAYDDYRRL